MARRYRKRRDWRDLFRDRRAELLECFEWRKYIDRMQIRNAFLLSGHKNSLARQTEEYERNLVVLERLNRISKNENCPINGEYQTFYKRRRLQRAKCTLQNPKVARTVAFTRGKPSLGSPCRPVGVFDRSEVPGAAPSHRPDKQCLPVTHES